MQVAVFHPGTQHSWQTALALQDLGALAWYATSIFYQPDRFPYRLERYVPAPIARRMHNEFKRFSNPRLNPDLIRTAGLSEWLERIAGRAGWRMLARRIDAFGNRQFAKGLETDIASDRRFALWGYNGSSLDAFELGRQHGRTCVLDRTIGDFRHYNARMAEVRERYGDWFLPSEIAVEPSHIERDQREYEASDIIVTGSEFAASTIRAHAGSEVAAKLRVLNYCYDEALFGNQPRPAHIANDGPVKFLFIGQISPRKGIHHLLEAIAQIPSSQASLTVLGELRIPGSIFARHADRITHIPTVARSDVPAIMADHHVLVFPSYFEGSALSLLEGLASGLALIQTPMSGMGVTPRTGLMLKEPDSETLLAAMLNALSDRERLNAWRLAAQDEAHAYSFASYRARIAALLETEIAD